MKFRYKLLIFTLLVLGCSFIVPGGKASTLYDSGRIIDDAVFLRSDAMSAQSIQDFLVSKGSGLANLSFNFDCTSTGMSDPYYRQAGAPCGQTVPASTIIYYTAQIYGVNPQVILATMQKEQSLITSPNPTVWQITQAMGYGCPDSGGCSPESGFLYQLDNGVWVLRFHMERARGNMTYWFTSTSWVCGTPKNYYKPSLYPGQNVNFYDDNGTLYGSYYIYNAATSSFYCYTPHAYNNPQGLYGLPRYGTTGQYYSGSYNFVTYFERWFGPTKGNLFRTSSSGVYLIENNTKRAIPSEEVFFSNGYKFSDVVVVNSTELNSYPDGAVVPYNIHYRDGRLVGTSSKGVFLVENGVKRAFPNEMTFLSYSYKWSDILTINPSELSLIPDGTAMDYNTHFRDGHLVTSLSGGVYVIDNGFKRPFPNEGTFFSYSYKYSDAMVISKIELSLIPEGVAIPYNVHLRDGRIITSTSVGVYRVENGVKRAFPNEMTFLSYSYKWSDILTINPSELSLIPDGTAMDYNTHFRDGHLVTSLSGGVYVIDNGFKRPFPNEGTFFSYSYKYSDAMVISKIELSLIPEGVAMPPKI